MHNRKVSYIFTLTTCLLFMLGATTTLRAQSDDTLAVTENHCLSVDDYQQLMHMDFSNTVFFLEEKGYQLGVMLSPADEIRRDTIQYIELRYQTKVFNNTSDKSSFIRIHFSNDGLCNILEDVHTPNEDCSLDNTFRSHPLYREDRQNGLFVGNNPDGNKIVEYIVQYQERNGLLHIVMTNVKERKALAEERYHERCDIMSDRLSKAALMARNNLFTTAISILDSVDPRFVPNDTIISNLRRRFIRRAENHYFPLILTKANQNDDIVEALKICDTLKSISPLQDSIQHIVNVLQNLKQGNKQLYSAYHPYVYNLIVDSLRFLVNNEIRNNLTDDPQHLRINFTFHTEKDNQSTYDVKLWPEHNTQPKNMSLIQSRLNVLNNRISSLANSPLIQPGTDHGIIVTTHQSLIGEVRWFYFNEKIINQCPPEKRDYQPFVDQIERQFFTVKTSRHTVTGDTVIARRRLPSQREYTFGVTHKNYNNSLYIDVALTDFKTPGPFSWMPSLIVPGLGTSRQGEPHSAAARALPFYIFTGFTIWGLSYESTHKEGRFDWDDSDSHMPWEYKNFGYWVATFCGTFAVSIYIYDLVQGISNSVNNMKRSKSLRNELKNGPITLQKQDVILWPSDNE